MNIAPINHRLYLRSFFIILMMTLFVRCETFEVNPATKLLTLEITADVTHAEATGRIIELSNNNNTDHGFFYATHPDPGTEDIRIRAAGMPSVGEFSVSIEDLLPNTTYYARAYCRDDDGYELGEIRSFTTDGISPAEVRTGDIFHRAPRGATVTGNVTDDAGYEITARGICWSTSPMPDISGDRSTEGTGTGEFASHITGLQPNQKYYVRAYATNTFGISYYGEEKTFETLTEGEAEDRDGNVYQSIEADGVKWMTENLKVTRYNDGGTINTGLNHTQWTNATEGAYGIYPHSHVQGINSDNEMKQAYGILYNWHAVNNSRGLCPPGWRVPSREDWDALIAYVSGGDNSQAGNLLKSCRQLGSPLGNDCNTSDHPRWDAHNEHYGSDEVGFSALPAGQRNDQGVFDGAGLQGSWWTSTSLGAGNAWRKMMYHDQGGVYESAISRNNGFSVRCIKE